MLVSPVSFSITKEQLAWLDQRRRHGSLSRSSALRQALDTAIAVEQGVPCQPQPQPGLASSSASSSSSSRR